MSFFVLFQDIHDHGIPWITTETWSPERVNIQYTDNEIDKEHEFCRVLEAVDAPLAEFIIRCVNAVPELLNELDKQQNYASERAREAYSNLVLLEQANLEKQRIQSQLNAVEKKMKTFQSERDYANTQVKALTLELETLRLQTTDPDARLTGITENTA